jgi:sec-independent protein translocase protein TatC
LRWTLVKMVATLGSAMILAFAFRVELAHALEEPLRSISGQGLKDLQTFNPVESMSISMTLAFYAGVILSFPLLLFFLAQFVLPALNQQERRYVIPGVGVGFALFLSGASFCFWFILPATLKWLHYDSTRMGFDPNWRAGDYFSFSTHFVLIFGMMFELPVVIMALLKIGILDASMLRRTRAYAFVIILVAAMIIAPAADPISMFIVAGPMLILYEACIWLAWVLERRERRLAMRATRTLDGED